MNERLPYLSCTVPCLHCYGNSSITEDGSPKYRILLSVIHHLFLISVPYKWRGRSSSCHWCVMLQEALSQANLMTAVSAPRESTGVYVGCMWGSEYLEVHIIPIPLTLVVLLCPRTKKHCLIHTALACKYCGGYISYCFTC